MVDSDLSLKIISMNYLRNPDDDQRHGVDWSYTNNVYSRSNSLDMRCRYLLLHECRETDERKTALRKRRGMCTPSFKSVLFLFDLI